jgi:FHA domain
MTDSLLNILKFALLALLYLFFARVLWAVWSEVRGPRGQAHPVAAGRPPKVKAPPKGKRGTVGRLIVLEPKASKGTAISLADEVTFGRAPGCTVSVPDDTFVSQVHARVFGDHGKIIIEDVGSTNGTYVNGTRITQALVLNVGDRIQIGSTVLEAS